MSARTGKHAPVGIAAHVVVLPAALVGVVQSHGNILIGRLSVEHRLDGFILPRGVYIHPVVLLRIVGNGVVLVAHALSVLAVPALEGVEVYPCSLAPPLGRCVTTTGMVGHEVVLVDRLDGGGQCFPHFRFDVALDVAPHEPDDVLFVFVSVGEERTVFLGILYAQLSVLHQSAPDTHHADVDAVLGSHIDDKVHVVPVSIHSFAVDVLEVPAVYVRHLAVDVHGWHTVDGLYLHHIVARLGARLQIPLGLGAVETLGQQPSCLALPEEGLSVFKLQITLVIRHT